MKASPLLKGGCAGAFFLAIANLAPAQASTNFPGFHPDYVRHFSQGMARGCRETSNEMKLSKPKTIADMKAVTRKLGEKYYVYRSRLPEKARDLRANYEGQVNGAVNYMTSFAKQIQAKAPLDKAQEGAYTACMAAIEGIQKLARPGGLYPEAQKLPELPRPAGWEPTFRR